MRTIYTEGYGMKGFVLKEYFEGNKEKLYYEDLMPNGIRLSNLTEERLTRARRRVEDRLRKDRTFLFRVLHHTGMIGFGIFSE